MTYCSGLYDMQVFSEPFCRTRFRGFLLAFSFPCDHAFFFGLVYARFRTPRRATIVAPVHNNELRFRAKLDVGHTNGDVIGLALVPFRFRKTHAILLLHLYICKHQHKKRSSFESLTQRMRDQTGKIHHCRKCEMYAILS